MEDVPDLVSALSYYSAEHGVPDIRLILNATGVETDELISAIKALRPLTEGERAIKGLQLVGIFVAPTEAPAAAQVAENAALLLSIDASTSFADAADTALAARKNRPWLSIRLDAATSTPQDPITDEHLTQLAEARINLGLSVCEPEEDETANDTVQALLAHAGEKRVSPSPQSHAAQTQPEPPSPSDPTPNSTHPAPGPSSANSSTTNTASPHAAPSPPSPAAYTA